MTEEIRPNLYRIELPLPRNPLKVLNSYVLTSPGRNLIIDTGFNRPECADALRAGLRELELDLGRTDFFVTHMHADHIGQVGALVQDGATVYFNRPEMAWFDPTGGTWNAMFVYAQANGFPTEELAAMRTGHPAARYLAPLDKGLIQVMQDGDVLAVGDYRLHVLETPGHSWGHLCLYEPRERLLFSGDHILEDITPNLQGFGDVWDVLGLYLDSLDKVYGYDVSLVLPGHRRLFTDHRARIDELKRHHEHRCEEMLQILQGGPLRAYEVASQMTWDIKAASWADFPVAQKWFAVGEALAHLHYEERRGRVRRLAEGEFTLFALA